MQSESVRIVNASNAMLGGREEVTATYLAEEIP